MGGSPKSRARWSHHIDKASFLALYRKARNQAFSASNICNGFSSTGLIPLDAQKILEKLSIRIDSNTPPTSLHTSHQSSWTSKTPRRTAEVQKQLDLIKNLANHQPESPSRHSALDELGKAYEKSMHEALMLQQQVSGLYNANKRQKRKPEKPRSYIATGGV